MNEFWEEYKRLEQLCNDIYQQQRGISLYIDEMRDAPARFTQKIDNWDYALKMLNRVRGIRNSMAHDVDVDVDDYDSEDLDFLRKLHEKILNRQDPLSVLRQLKEEASRPKPKLKPKPQVEPIVEPELRPVDNNTQESKAAVEVSDDGDEKVAIKEIIIAFAIGGGIGGLIAFIYFFLL